MWKKLKKWVRKKGEPKELKVGAIATYRDIPVKLIGIKRTDDHKVYYFRNLHARKAKDLFFGVKFKKASSDK